MSGRNGDKARFNIYRRRKLAKRQRVRAFFAAQTRANPAGAAVVARAEPAKRPAARPAAAAAKPTAAAKAEKKPRPKTTARQ